MFFAYFGVLAAYYTEKVLWDGSVCLSVCLSVFCLDESHASTAALAKP
jgi:hypothetical protein